MTVLQINAVYGVGSTGRNVKEAHEYLQKNGITSYVATTHTKIRNPHIYQIGNPIDWKLHAFFSRLTGLQGYFSRRATVRLIRWMEKIRPSVVHLHNLHGNYLNLGMLFQYLKENDIPTVITLHDCWFYTGKCVYYTREQCYKWKGNCHVCPQLRVDNPSWFFDRTFKTFSDKKFWLTTLPRLAVIGVSDWIVKEAKQSFLKEACIIRRIYNWVDQSTFKSIKDNNLKAGYDLENKFLILGVSGKWSERKGLNCFLELSSLLKDDEIILLVGELSDIQLPSNIIHVASTNNTEELAEYYAMADVYLQPSYEETFGKVVAEALCCGTPVVAVNSTANPELVPPQCGIVIDSTEPDKVYDAVKTIRKKTKYFYSQNCRKFAEDKFSKDKNLDQHIELYNEIIY